MSGTRIHYRYGGSSSSLVVVLVLWCLSVSYTTAAGATNLRRPPLQRVLQQSDTADSNFQVTFTTIPGGTSDDDQTTPSRLVLDPLTVRLSPRTAILSTVDLRFLQNTMEVMAIEYVVAMKNGGSRNRRLASSEFEYVRFGSAKQVYNDAGTAIVTFALVVAQFSSQPTPDADTVSSWIEQSLASANLLPELQSSDSGSFATLNNVSVAFAMSSNAPPANDTTSSPTTEKTQNSTERSNSVPIIAGAAVGGLVVCVLLLAAVFTKSRRREVIPVESPLHLADTDFSASSPQKKPSRSTHTTPASTPDSKPEAADSRSFADSESEWTVGTEAGDSMALKSLVPPSAAASVSLRHPEPWVLSESFERDRPVNITKDMLTGQWSGRVSNLRASTGAAHSDSVLQPSYFSASQERRVRKAAADRESSGDDEEESGGEDALVFEQAHAAGGRPGAWSPARTRHRAASPRPTTGELS
jgi:hypothetical protein